MQVFPMDILSRLYIPILNRLCNTTHKKSTVNTALLESARRDSNPRPQPWQGCTPPLSHSRIYNFLFLKAGDGNRTHVSSLEGWCSTIELHLHISGNITSTKYFTLFLLECQPDFQIFTLQILKILLFNALPFFQITKFPPASSLQFCISSNVYLSTTLSIA